MSVMDTKRMTKVLNIIANREIDNDIVVEKLFGLMTDIVLNLKETLKMSDENLRYDRKRWIDRGTEEEWWSSPIDYQKDTDIESLAIQFAQMLKYGHLIKAEKKPTLKEDWFKR